jgi:uncharacterized membrane protein YgaE (UPF0421/DUF939 family)
VRLKKSFTLHDAGQQNGSIERDDAEDAPLLEPGASNTQGYTSGLVLATKTRLQNAKEFILSDLGRGIFKCALAYLLGSLATFIPPFSGLFGRSDSKHMVATITVYFHPARSLGSMLEALMLAWAAFFYTALVSLVSMSIAAFFADTVHNIVIGYIIVLVLFVGGGLGFVAWVKLKKGDALVNIACSLASLTLITLLTKEGAVQAGDYSFERISQILRMLIAGIIATTTVSFLIFPISARRELRENLVDATDCLSDMLALVTSSFISGDENELKDQVLSSVTERHKKTVASLVQHLKESKYEHYLLGTEKQARFEARLSGCLQRIAQSIGGLRNAAAMQFVVVKQLNQANSNFRSRMATPFGSLARTPSSTTALGDHGSTGYVHAKGREETISDDGATAKPWRTSSQIFDLFLDHLGGPMRSLAFTLKEILDDLQLTTSKGYGVEINPKFRTSLQRALELYKDARRQALNAVYDKKDLDRRRPIEVEADWEEAAACCGHFSFSLLEVAEDVKNFLIILDDMQLEVEEQPSGRSWSWLKFWTGKDSKVDADAESEFAILTGKVSDLGVQLRQPQPKVPEARRPDPSDSSWKQWKQREFRKLYDALAFFRRDDIKFAIKVSFGAMLYALPSFIPSTRPFYSRWRGEWGLLSYMLVCSMIIGASNTTGYSRILGTVLGAVMAIVAWEISNQHPVALAIFGFCMAYWTAYIIIGKGKGPMGRFIMLTYNLSALYAYSLAVQDDEDDGDEEDRNKNPLIFEISGHRVAAVISGCIWGLIITRLVWPISARERLKEGLSLLWLRMGLIWKRDPLSVFMEGEDQNQYMNLREEFELQRYMAKLQELVDASKNEFELKGPFPYRVYSEILKSTEQMLDAFHAMNVVILKDLRATPGEEALLQATALERSQLCSRISHMFSVLASSMKLEYALDNDALPNIDNTRDRLLARIFAYRKTNAEQEQTSDEDFGILYTYALVTGQLAQEIQAVLKLVESLFGVIDEEALMLQ